MRCLLCNSRKSEFVCIYKGEDIYLRKLNIANFALKWFRCAKCGVYFSQQYKNIEKVYDNELLYDAQFDKESIRIRYEKIMSLDERKSDNALRVKRVKSFHSAYVESGVRGRKPFNVLDIGAGMGVFLAKFLDSDYKGYALEVNRVAAQHIREELRIPVYRDYVQNLKTGQKFDLITMNKVLEHIKRPIDVLRSIQTVLHRNGIIYLELPDTRGYELDGAACDGFSSGHYMVYNPQSVLYLLDQAGFDILHLNRVCEPSGKKTIYSFARRKLS
ncbi:MAG: class I SAM-dependent methyltransferase [Nitrospirota bacterium]